MDAPSLLDFSWMFSLNRFNLGGYVKIKSLIHSAQNAIVK